MVQKKTPYVETYEAFFPVCVCYAITNPIIANSIAEIPAAMKP